MQLSKLTITNRVSLPISASTIVSFTPASYAEKPARPVYRLRVPTFRTRAEVERETLPIALSLANETDLNAAAIDAVKNVVAEAERAAVLEVLGAYGALLDGPAPAAGDDTAPRDALAKQAKEIHMQLAPHWAPLLQIIQDRILAMNLIRYVAARQHCAGWSTVGDLKNFPDAVTGPDGIVTDGSFGMLPVADITAIADEVNRLGSPDQATEKN